MRRRWNTEIFLSSASLLFHGGCDSLTGTWRRNSIPFSVSNHRYICKCNITSLHTEKQCSIGDVTTVQHCTYWNGGKCCLRETGTGRQSLRSAFCRQSPKTNGDCRQIRRQSPFSAVCGQGFRRPESGWDKKKSGISWSSGATVSLARCDGLLFCWKKNNKKTRFQMLHECQEAASVSKRHQWFCGLRMIIIFWTDACATSPSMNSLL